MFWGLFEEHCTGSLEPDPVSSGASGLPATLGKGQGCWFSGPDASSGVPRDCLESPRLKLGAQLGAA